MEMTLRIDRIESEKDKDLFRLFLLCDSHKQEFDFVFNGVNGTFLVQEKKREYKNDFITIKGVFVPRRDK